MYYFFSIGTGTLNAQDIFTAIRNKDISIVRDMIENDPDILNRKDRNQMTPLYFAAYYGVTDAVELLIDKGSDVNCKRSNGEAAIHLAAYFDHIDVVRLLAENGADINTDSYRGRTPIVSAIEGGASKVSAYLLDRGAEVPMRSAFLHIAAKNGLKKIVEYMIENDIEISLETGRGSTLLHTAAEGGLVDLAKIAIEKGVDINRRDYYGITPLHLASRSGNISMIEFLVSKGVDLNLKTFDGRSPYHIAASNGNEVSSTYLMEKGAEAEFIEYIDSESDIYLGQKKPVNIPEVFTLGILSINEGEHGAPAFSPREDEIYWAYNYRTTYYTRKENGKWILPRPAPLWEKYRAANPVFSNDGSKLYFHSSLTMDGERKRRDSEIWYVEKTGSGWGEPVNIGPEINSGGNETFCSFTKNGTIYFISDYDIYCSEYINGQFSKRVRLPEPVNSDSPEISLCIAPDESFLIFESMRPGGEEELMLYICFREEDGSWSKPVSLGEDVNENGARFPGLSPDGKYFFFTKNFDIYWVNSGILNEHRKK